jgi:hypothetical protein
VPEERLFDAAGESPDFTGRCLSGCKQGAEIWLLTEAEVSKNGISLDEPGGRLKVGTEAIALFPPDIPRHGAADSQQRFAELCLIQSLPNYL